MCRRESCSQSGTHQTEDGTHDRCAPTKATTNIHTQHINRGSGAQFPKKTYKKLYLNFILRARIELNSDMIGVTLALDLQQVCEGRVSQQEHEDPEQQSSPTP